LTILIDRFIKTYRIFFVKGKDMELKFKVWLEKDGEVLVGNGKVGLLQRIDELGSIQRAAEKNGMSYRHAWGMIQKIEKRSGFKFVETQVGGKEGGSARLTPQGKEFLNQYSAFRRGLDEVIGKKFLKAFKK
jgi:molybdate transport system regulatory protein